MSRQVLLGVMIPIAIPSALWWQHSAPEISFQSLYAAGEQISDSYLQVLETTANSSASLRQRAVPQLYEMQDVTPSHGIVTPKQPQSASCPDQTEISRDAKIF